MKKFIFMFALLCGVVSCTKETKTTEVVNDSTEVVVDSVVCNCDTCQCDTCCCE